jgi:hypothetical protein
MDRGSLVTPPLTALQFLAVYAWPITPAENAVAEQGKHTRGRGRLGEARTGASVGCCVFASAACMLPHL